MPFRFSRTIKIAPGIRLNFNKKSTSVRFGGRGAGVTLSSNGKTTRTIGIPGTGAYWTKTESSGNAAPTNAAQATRGCGATALAVIVLAAFLAVSAWIAVAG